MNAYFKSIQTKVLVATAATFLTVLLTALILGAKGERDLIAEIGADKASDVAMSYFIGLNAMMLSGTVDQKEGFRNKVLGQGGVKDVRVVHGDALKGGLVQNLVGPRDELERRALTGETIKLLDSVGGERVVTYLTPIRASSNFLGTNCLTCHPVPENTVVSAVRVSYSLAHLDKQSRRSLYVNGGINLVLFAGGVWALLWLLKRIVVTPLLHMRETMHRIESESDLSLRVQAGEEDEMGGLARALNGLLDQFTASLARMAESAGRLSTAADSIAQVSDQTAQAADRQRNEMESAVGLIDGLQSIGNQVVHCTGDTAAASRSAEQLAQSGTATMREAIGGILGLVREIEQVADTIKQLDQRSRNVNSILDVIGGIAKQTNLLALNAAIEAARAGESGRGFSVVADEVRNLANMSHESTQRIKNIVDQLQNEAMAAVDCAELARGNAESRGEQLEQALSQLDQIVSCVTQICTANEGTVSSVARQEELTAEASQRIFTVSDIAGRTASEAMQTRAIGEQLVGMAHELNALVARFKLS